MGLTTSGTAAVLRIHGRLALTVIGPDGEVRGRREGDNVMCTAGLGPLAAAMVWSGIEDQAANQGVTTPTFLTPLYGAVGNGAGTVDPSDTALWTELGRQTVGAGGSTPATSSLPALATFLFYFPSPASTWTVTEAGVFANATADAGAGAMIDHWAFSPTLTVTTADTLILQASFSVGG